MELTFTSKYMHRSPERGGVRIETVTCARETEDPLVPLECLSEPVEETPREASLWAFFAFIASIRARLSAVAVGLELITVV